MDQYQILNALFPRTVKSTEQGGGFIRRSISGALDAASIPGRAYGALWNRYNSPILENMSLINGDTHDSRLANTLETIIRDPSTITIPFGGGPTGTLAKSLASRLSEGIIKRAAEKAIPELGSLAMTAGSDALSQYSVNGTVDPLAVAKSVAMNAGGILGGKILNKASSAITKSEAAQNLEKWFSGSKVVDKEGRPLVVYHGTSADFDEFNPKKVGSTYGADKKGFFFSENPEIAHNASIDARYSSGGAENIMPVYLDIKNPFEPNLTTDAFDALDKALLIRKAQKNGADGIKLSDGTWIALSPTQIKSATGNSGAFSRGTNSIIGFNKSGPSTNGPIDNWYSLPARRLFNSILNDEYQQQNSKEKQ